MHPVHANLHCAGCLRGGWEYAGPCKGPPGYCFSRGVLRGAFHLHRTPKHCSPPLRAMACCTGSYRRCIPARSRVLACEGRGWRRCLGWAGLVCAHLGGLRSQTRKVATGVFQQVRLLHLLVNDSAQNSKITVISAVRIHRLRR